MVGLRNSMRVRRKIMAPYVVECTPEKRMMDCEEREL